MNNVKKAFILLKEHDLRLEILAPESIFNFFNQDELLKRALWLAVYKSTKAINPGLINDIKNGLFDADLTPSMICFLDKHWGVLGTNSKCNHCGKIHHE
jgi:hypothetical protein